MKSILSYVILISVMLASNASATVVSYQLTGIFDFFPQIYVYDEGAPEEEPDTSDWGLLPQLFGASFALSFDIDENSSLSNSSGAGQAAFFNFNGAASNISLTVGGAPFASAASGDVRQVLAQASHTWILDAEGMLAGPPLELFDFENGVFTGYTVGQPSLTIGLIDSDQTAYATGANELIGLSEDIFLGDAPVGFITDSLDIFLSSDGEPFTDYSITGTVSSITVIPLPAAAWLFISALGGLIVTKRRRPA